MSKITQLEEQRNKALEELFELKHPEVTEFSSIKDDMTLLIEGCEKNISQIYLEIEKLWVKLFNDNPFNFNFKTKEGCHEKCKGMFLNLRMIKELMIMINEKVGDK